MKNSIIIFPRMALPCPRAKGLYVRSMGLKMTGGYNKIYPSTKRGAKVTKAIVSKLKSVPAPELVTSAFIAFLLTVFLLAVPADGYLGISMFKYTLLLSACGAYAALMAGCGAYSLLRRNGARRGNRAGFGGIRAVCLLLCAYVLFSAVSALLSEYGGTFLGPARREGVLTAAAYVASALFIARFARPGAWMLWLFGASITLFCALSAVQFTGANPFGLYPEGLSYLDSGVRYSGEYFGTLGNAGMCAAVLCVSAGVFLMALFRARGRIRWLALLPLGLTLYVIFRSDVEAGKLGVLLGVLFMLPAAAGERFLLRRAAFISVPAVLVLGLICLLLCDFGGSGALHEAHELLCGRWDDSFGSGRLYIWRSCWDLFRERPLFGGGPDTLGMRCIEPFRRWDETRGMLVKGIDNAHNEYLNILVNQGLFSLLAYLTALILTAVKWYRRPGSAACAVSGAGVLFYCIQAFFGISMCMSAPYFWLALGLTLSALREERRVPL